MNRETPPRMRGRLPVVRIHQPLPRNTPAYAGKTRRQAHGRRAPWKHPRVCGEDNWRSMMVFSLLETPPRMRGRQMQAGGHEAVEGNTPAYAGKTSAGSQAPPEHRKHPRVCGEDSVWRRQTQIPRETPPRMRGRPPYRDDGEAEAGNTPAYAGKTVKKN